MKMFHSWHNPACHFHNLNDTYMIAEDYLSGQFTRLFISYSSTVFMSRFNNLTNKSLQLDFSELVSLEQFLLSYNDVTDVDDTLFDECTKLQVFKLQNNKLTTVPNLTAAGNSLIQLQLGKPFPVSMVSKVYFMIIDTLKYLCDSRRGHCLCTFL